MNVNMKGEHADGQKRLTEAARNGDLYEVEFLISIYDVETNDVYGQTPLSHAAFGGHLKIVESLVNRGAMVDAKDYGGVTPLSLAAYGGYLDIVKFLVDHGANVDAKDNYCKTPVSHAAFNRKLEVVEFLETVVKKQQAVGGVTKSATRRHI